MSDASCLDILPPALQNKRHIVYEKQKSLNYCINCDEKKMQFSDFNALFIFHISNFSSPVQYFSLKNSSKSAAPS